MLFSLIGARVCEYFKGNHYSNKPVTFSPNNDHWPASTTTKDGCRELCQSMDNCPQADFYPDDPDGRKCWLYRSDTEWDKKVRKPYEDYIICEKG